MHWKRSTGVSDLRKESSWRCSARHQTFPRPLVEWAGDGFATRSVPEWQRRPTCKAAAWPLPNPLHGGACVTAHRT
ncbi:hypothetical protein ppKF707_5755 [Metapseudomonas furukawaii]|uniref:Uncharacterized protein n=1 Tax=Metapseudomonas furukawaii TaxID=1149133 RepID=A0AAD1BZH5_METFU|nr:hypothetical protein ppKF707_5755 [Pseudomonas furukawaii]BAU72819.1 hypothetical protein KF707C_11310 [Pseudomonas furukawaii]